MKFPSPRLESVHTCTSRQELTTTPHPGLFSQSPSYAAPDGCYPKGNKGSCIRIVNLGASLLSPQTAYASPSHPQPSLPGTFTNPRPITERFSPIYTGLGKIPIYYWEWWREITEVLLQIDATTRTERYPSQQHQPNTLLHSQANGPYTVPN